VGQVVHFVASLATYDGTDNAHLRYQNLGGDGVEVKVEEDTTADTEMNHTGEEVHYLAMVVSVQGGTLTGQAVLTETAYYHFGGQRVAMRKGDVVYYTLADHLGTTSLVLRQVGSSIVKVAESRHRAAPRSAVEWATPTENAGVIVLGHRAVVDVGVG
jgi:hypothetical protein